MNGTGSRTGHARGAGIVPPPLHRAGAIAWRVLVVVALLAIVIWLAFLLGTVTASILVALIVGATFAPVTRGLRARGWSRAKASAVVTVSAVLVAGAVITLVVLAFVPYAGQIATFVEAGAAELKPRLQDAQLSPVAATAIETGSPRLGNGSPAISPKSPAISPGR